MTLALSAWAASWTLSVAASPLWSDSLSRSAWIWTPLHKNDIAIVPIIAALIPGWAAFVTLGALVAVANSRNAMLGMFIVALIRARGIGLWLLLGGATAVVTVAFALDLYFVGRGTARLGQWVVALRMWQEAPWLGQGPFTFLDYYAMWLPASLPFGIIPQAAIVPWAHNLYLEVLAERGLIGFTVFVSIVTWAFIRASFNVRTALAAFLVMGIFDLTFLKPWVSLAFWSLVGAATIKVPSNLRTCELGG